MPLNSAAPALNFSALGLIALLCFATLSAGCATSSGPASQRNAAQTQYLLGEAGDDLAQARRLIDHGRFYEAVPQLQRAIMKAPDSEAGITSRYLLGVTYSSIANYWDAMEMFTEYLEVAPDGRHAGEARDQLARLQNQYDTLYPSPDELDREIAALEERANGDPGSIDTRLQLADAYWRRGNYNAAAAIYAHAVAQRPELSSHSAIVNRVDFLNGGEYVVLTPQELRRREIERQPVVITNENAFKSRRDTFTGVPRLYVVTGQVVNRSDSILYGVEIVCTIYGFGNVVYDTSSSTIGRLHPGETRAYSVRFADFENINAIQRHECYVTFQ